MFIDEAKIYVKAGGGGNGCNSLHRDKVHRRGYPDGGPGGNGGDIVFIADKNIHTLLDFHYRQHFTGLRGAHGGSNNKKGANGQPAHIKVPVGTIIKDFERDIILRDLAKEGDSVIIARGGDGGRGNSRGRPARDGSQGEEKTLYLELKMIADVGIIGYPNAGKSTLISKISSARPKIASYPFTTREPVLGVVKLGEGFSIVMADIPGLIEGAHGGKGLGDKFLRHIERTSLLIHMVDIASIDARDPRQDYSVLNKELKLYSEELAKRHQIVVLNKIDMPSSEKNIRDFKKSIGSKNVFPISALTGKGLKELLSELRKRLSHAPVPPDGGTVRGSAPRRNPEKKGAMAVKPRGST